METLVDEENRRKRKQKESGTSSEEEKESGTSSEEEKDLKMKREKVIRDMALINCRLGKTLSWKSQLSKEKAKIICELKEIERKVQSDTKKLMDLEIEKVKLFV